MAIASTNPTTGEVLKSFDEIGDEELESRLSTAWAAFESYRLTEFSERARWMRAAADILDAEQQEVATMMTQEMGKTIVAARQEVEKCAKTCRFFAANAEGFLADEPADAKATGAVEAYVTYQPLGPVLAVMPWNFPLWQAMRFAAPALMAGNVGLLKHASNVPQTALFMQDLFERAGFPKGAFQTLLISARRVAGVLDDPRVVAATLTGSGPAGSAVASAAGRNIKKTVLELGGTDPFVVMPSADVRRAAEVATTARLINNGQSCINAKRFVVHADVFDEFRDRFVEGMGSKVIGDPLDERTEVGPLASEQQLRDISEIVDDAVSKGATVLCGGKPLDRPGYFYPPTVLTDVVPGMRAHLEEVFGPVATLYRVSGIDEAIALANATEFGLGANVWTEDTNERTRFIRDVSSGMVFVNGNTTSFPELPFGGVRSSGYGRELSSHGIKEFCNAKTVWVGKGSSFSTE